MSSPTQRSIQWLKERGYTCCIAEHYNAFAHVRKDLFGWIDIVALHPDKKGVLGIQCTTGSNISARITKAEALKSYGLWIACGNTALFMGWRKLKTGKVQRTWHPHITEVSLENLL